MKAKNISIWILQGILAGFFLLAGSTKLAGAERTVEAFRNWGYDDGFRLLIGVLEAIGGVALLIPRASAVSALGLMVIMLGAAFTHILHEEGLRAAVPASVLLGLLGLVALKTKRQTPFER